MKVPVELTKDGILLRIHVQPGASQTGWAGMFGESVKLRIAARPVEGQANSEVCEFIARHFGVSKSSVAVTHGVTGRSKTVKISGNPSLLAAAAEALLA